MAFAVKAVIEKVELPKAVSVEGDVRGSSTIPMMAARTFRTSGSSKPASSSHGQVFCFLASVGHWHDVGGNVPGNYNPAATESVPGGAC